MKLDRIIQRTLIGFVLLMTLSVIIGAIIALIVEMGFSSFLEGTGIVIITIPIVGFLSYLLGSLFHKITEDS